VRVNGNGQRMNYYPYGAEVGAETSEGRVKFGTYTRDSAGVDYADQRYYGAGMGRFMTPDPGFNSNAVVLPGNWNRYGYVGGDPINKTDPRGLCSPEDNPPCYSVTGTGEGPTGTGGTGFGGIGGSGACPSNDSKYVDDGCIPSPGGLGGGGGAPGAIMIAERGAADRLFNPDCAGLFLAPDANTAANRKLLSNQLDTIEDRGLIRKIDPTALPSGGNPNIPGFTTGPDGLIYLVSGGAFFTGLVDGKPLGGFAAGMSLTDFQQLVIIHEFLHWDDIAGPDASGQKYTLPNGDKVKGSAGISKEIKTKCFN
jgi:RHS repeat-associated protein